MSQAQVYEAEGNDPQTYLLLYRHADLVLQNLQTHPDRNQLQNKKALNAATTTVYSDLKKLETIAPRIKKRHEEFQERRRKQQDALKALEGSGARDLPQELDGLSLQDRGLKRRSYDSRPTLDASENHSLATRLAQREVRRRDTARRTVRQHGVTEEEEQQRRTGGRWESWQHDLAHDDGRGDLLDQLQEVARLQQNGANGQKPSYSEVRYISSIHVWNIDSCSNLHPATHTPTTTRQFPTSLSKEICHTLALSSLITLQHAHQKNKSTDPQARPQYHHPSHPSHETIHSSTPAHPQYPGNTPNHLPPSPQSLAKSSTTDLPRPQRNWMISPSNPPPTSKTATPCAPSSSPPNCANNSCPSHLPTHGSISRPAACCAAS